MNFSATFQFRTKLIDLSYYLSYKYSNKILRIYLIYKTDLFLLDLLLFFSS
jgi:hypothetical protein